MKRKLGTTRGYESYVRQWYKQREALGGMEQPLMDYEDYKYAYEAYYMDRTESGKDTKNINRLIVADQSYAYNRAQARARQAFLRDFGGRRALQKDLRTGRVDITEEEWNRYKKTYHEEKARWQKEYGDDFDMDEFYAWLGQSYWGSD